MIAIRRCGIWLLLLHVFALGISSALAGPSQKGGITWVGSEPEEIASRPVSNHTTFFSSFDGFSSPAWLFNALPGSSRMWERASTYSPMVFDRAGDRVDLSGDSVRVRPNEFNAATFFYAAPFQYERNASIAAPSAVTTIKQFDGANGSWALASNWAPDGVPTSSDDVVFSNAFLNPLPNISLGGGDHVANNILISLTASQSWALGANSNAGGGGALDLTATLTLTSGGIQRLDTVNSSVTNIGASDGTGTLVGVTTLATTAPGFAITNHDTDGILRIDAIISGANKFVDADGDGTVVLGGANTYTGFTSAHDGVSLLINGDQSAATGAVTVQTIGTLLGGTGTIGGAVTVDQGARITGGAEGTVGALTLNKSLTFSALSGTDGTYLVDFSGGTSDLLAIAGVLDLSGTFDQLTLNNSPNGIHSYVLATYGSVIGQFDVLTNIPANYQLVYGDHSLSLVLVPEPSTWIGAALALVAIGFTQRSRLRSLVCRA